MIMTLDEARNRCLMRVRFPADNNVRFGMDFGFYEGAPSDRDFYAIKRAGDFTELVAEGYGVKGSYGNGSIHVPTKYLYPDGQSS